MSFNAKDLAQAQVMVLQAEIVKGALTKLFEAAKTLQAGTKDPFLAHQVIKQALASAGISKIVDATDELQKKYLAGQERKEVVTEAIGIDSFLVPSYRYTPADKVSAKLTNSDSKVHSRPLRSSGVPPTHARCAAWSSVSRPSRAGELMG